MFQAAIAGVSEDKMKTAVEERLQGLLEKRMHRYQEAEHEIVCSFATVETCVLLVKNSIDSAAKKHAEELKNRKKQESQELASDG